MTQAATQPLIKLDWGTDRPPNKRSGGFPYIVAPYYPYLLTEEDIELLIEDFRKRMSKPRIWIQKSEEVRLSYLVQVES